MEGRKEELKRLMRQQKRGQRINSPLVRYNNLDQPVCRVCGVVIKSEALWPAHCKGQQHIENLLLLKETKGKKASSEVESEAFKKPAQKTPPQKRKEPPQNAKPTLPADFFDDASVQQEQEMPVPQHKKPKIDNSQPEAEEFSIQEAEAELERLVEEGRRRMLELQSAARNIIVKESTNTTTGPDATLPEGFFDNDGSRESKPSLAQTHLEVRTQFPAEREDLEVDASEELKEEELEDGTIDEAKEELALKAQQLAKIQALRARKASLTKLQQPTKSVYQKEEKQGDGLNESDSSGSEDEDEASFDWRSKIV